MTMIEWSIVVYALLIFLCVVSQASYTALTDGLGFGFSNRSKEPSLKGPIGHRIDRTLGNLKEGGIIYLPLALLAASRGLENPWIHYAALVTIISRVLYVPIYVAGVPVIRTLVWSPSLFAIPALAYGIFLESAI